ncbi:hypothetical protein ACOMHN_008581 [Nucella lapillus]
MAVDVMLILNATTTPTPTPSSPDVSLNLNNPNLNPNPNLNLNLTLSHAYDHGVFGSNVTFNQPASTRLGRPPRSRFVLDPFIETMGKVSRDGINPFHCQTI